MNKKLAVILGLAALATLGYVLVKKAKKRENGPELGETEEERQLLWQGATSRTFEELPVN